jgi:hypothetical protein
MARRMPQGDAASGGYTWLISRDFLREQQGPETKRNPNHPSRCAHSGIGVGIEKVVIRIAQAAIAEAEPHRRRFPNFCLRKGCRDYQPRGGPLRGALPPAAGEGKSETPSAERPWA